MAELIHIELTEELARALPSSPEQEIRMAAAAKLFELGRLSSGRAAELAGISRVAFLQEVGAYGVSVFQLTPEELELEIESARPDHGQ